MLSKIKKPDRTQQAADNPDQQYLVHRFSAEQLHPGHGRGPRGAMEFEPEFPPCVV
ncbi:MAG: hypothetical protein MUP41_04765 [Desulfobacterales bacterium]|nr:hypothetical protein [Desulfobacterales bacterium]